MIKFFFLLSFSFSTFASWELCSLNLQRSIERIKSIADKREISYGPEIEFSLDQSPELLDYYKIPLINSSTWVELSLDERILKAKAYIKEVSLEHSKLELFNSFNPKLPKFIYPEEHGTFEINRVIHKSKADYEYFVKDINKRIPNGYHQNNLVWRYSGLKTELIGLKGYSIYSSIYEAIKTLNFDYLRGTKNPGKFMTHGSLNLISEKDLDSLNILINSAHNDELFKKKVILGNNAISVRKDGSTIGDGNIGIELRSLHRDEAKTLDETKELYKRLSSKEAPFLDYSHFQYINPPGFNAIRDNFILNYDIKKIHNYDSLLNKYDIQKNLESFFVNLEIYFESIGKEIDLTRNFMLPFSLSDHKLLGITDSVGITKVEQAFSDFIHTFFSEIIDQTSITKINNDEFMITNETIQRLKIIIAKFIHDSDLVNQMPKTIKEQKLETSLSNIINFQNNPLKLSLFIKKNIENLTVVTSSMFSGGHLYINKAGFVEDFGTNGKIKRKKKEYSLIEELFFSDNGNIAVFYTPGVKSLESFMNDKLSRKTEVARMFSIALDEYPLAFNENTKKLMWGNVDLAYQEYYEYDSGIRIIFENGFNLFLDKNIQNKMQTINCTSFVACQLNEIGINIPSDYSTAKTFFKFIEKKNNENNINNLLHINVKQPK